MGFLRCITDTVRLISELLGCMKKLKVRDTEFDLLDEFSTFVLAVFKITQSSRDSVSYLHKHCGAGNKLPLNTALCQLRSENFESHF
jgi:hypothetical protein